MSHPYLVFNIETVREEKLPERLVPQITDFQPTKEVLKKGEKSPTAVLEYQSEKLEEARSKMSLNPLTGRIIALSMKTNGGDIVTAMDNGNEKEIVKFFWETFKKAVVDVQGTLVGYNSKSFDLPFLMNAALRLGVKVEGVDVYKYLYKYGHGYHMDVYTVLSNFEPKKGTLGDWAERLGCTPVWGKGDKVGEWFSLKQYENIAKHCGSNVLATEGIFVRLIDTFGVPRL